MSVLIDLASQVGISYAIPALIAGSVATVHAVTKLYQEHCAQFTQQLPASLSGRATPEAVYQEKRVLNALQVRNESEKVEIHQLDKESLGKLAQDVNGSFIHASGNCVLLSTALLYNLFNKTNSLSVSNTSPPFLGIQAHAAEQILFGSDFICFGENITSIDEVENQVLDAFYLTGIRAYTVEATRYQLPVFKIPVGHVFNAIVIRDAEGTNHVQFVDAWRSSHPTPSKEEAQANYSQQSRFAIKSLNPGLLTE